MSSEWCDTTIGQVCARVYSGGTPTSTNLSYYGGDIPWLRTKEVNYRKIYTTEERITQLGHENSAAKLVPANSVIVAMYGNGDTAGRVAINKVPLTTNQACCNLVVDPNVADYRFVYYFLQSKYQALVDLKNGGAQQNLNGQLIKAFPLSIPSLSEQAAIADLLEALDDRITLLRETNATLEAIAQALFKSWFVDFDPVRAKRDGRAPEGMDEATAALFPDSFENSELGEVPRGWSIGSIASLMRLHKGTVNPAESPEKWFQHFSLPAYDDGQSPALQQGTEIKSNKTSVPERAVLLSKLNPHIPRVWLPSTVSTDAVCSTEFLVFVPSEVTTTNFVYSLLNASDFCVRLCQLVTGTSNSHQRVKPDSVLCLPQVIPAPECIRAYDLVVEGLYERLKLNREAYLKLADLRDTLLPRLISGQLRLPRGAGAGCRGPRCLNRGERHESRL